MGQAAPTTRPPGSAAALAREALQQASADEREEMLPAAQPRATPRLAAKYAAGHHPAPPPRRRGTCSRSPARRRARRRSQRCRRSSNTGNRRRSSTSKMMMTRTTRITKRRRCCCCCFTRGHEPDDVFSRKWLKRLCFLHVVLGFALFWLLVLAVVIFPSSSTFGALRELPLRVLVRCLACGLCALTALRVPLDARELNATLPKAALAKVLDVVASCWVWAALVPAFVRTYIAAVAHDQSAWMVALLCVVSFVTDVSGVCVTWVAVTPLCLGDLLPIAAREEAMDEYIEEDDREDIIVEIGSLLATPRGARDVV